MKWYGVLAGALVLAGCNPSASAPEAADAAPAPGEVASGADEAEAGRPQRRVRPPSDFAALSGYSDGWSLKAGWQGEYPPGFAVLDANVRVPARARPNPGDPQDITCLLPQYANYHLWNEERVESDNLEFFTATKKFPVTVLEDAEVEFIANRDIETLSLRAGDRLTYTGYIGEGFLMLTFNDRQFQINESELREITDIGAIQNEDHLWVRVACLAGREAWLMFDEVIAEDGIYASPFSSQRYAEDIYPEDVESVRAMMNPDMFGLPPGGGDIRPPSPE
ncbi:hypothetical protein [Hyphomonas sp.]|uniref:hypothetical protein n=1 Tax=Hyphomonas sp. TaxID=87 RepID=UPI00391B1ACE